MELTGVELCCNAVQYNPRSVSGWCDSHRTIGEGIQYNASVGYREDINLSWGIDSEYCST